IFDEHHGNYGYRRIQLALKAQGINVNQKKVRRIMGKLGLKGTIGRVAKNLIHRRFYTSIPHQKVTTDTSEFKYYEHDKNKK
ncbi:IS3 family transposase, partial [Listeria seeligeri]|uniref:IS3 family transposase n=1 Tax=Listeria seeligeri TaxID=1640 RepID=UPI0022EA855A